MLVSHNLFKRGKVIILIGNLGEFEMGDKWSYTNSEKVRILLGVDSSIAPDVVLQTFIQDAIEVIIRRVSARVLNEEPTTGATDFEFFTKHPFMADIDGDKEIKPITDFIVWAWTDLEDEDTKTDVSSKVDTLKCNPLTGRIVLTETYDYITVDYSYYLNIMDFDLAGKAAAYYAGRMWIERELLLVPKHFKLGKLTIKGYPAWEVFKTNFERIMHLLVSCPMDKVGYEKMILGSRESTLKAEIGE